MSYILYIDESGDEGIDPKNKKQSPYFFLGAFLVKEDNQQHVLNKIQSCEKELKKEIHFSNLKHEQKKHVCGCLANMPVRFFGLVSDKKGLDIQGYRSKLIQNKNVFGLSGTYYNKNVHYLLERVALFCKENGITVSKIIFDKIETKDYQQLSNYISKIANNPIHGNAKMLQLIDPDSIEAFSVKDKPLLKVADAMANSLNRAFVAKNIGGVETSYLNDLMEMFATDSNGNIIDYSLIIKPRGLTSLGLDKDHLDFFQNFKADNSMSSSRSA